MEKQITWSKVYSLIHLFAFFLKRSCSKKHERERDSV